MELYATLFGVSIFRKTKHRKICRNASMLRHTSELSMESNNSCNLSNIWRNSILVRDLRRNTMLGTNMLACPDDYALHNRLKLPNAQETTFVKLHP